MIFKFSQVILLGLLSVLFVACSTTSLPTTNHNNGAIGSSLSPEKLVLQRAQKRWDALMSGELNTAYTYISPAGRSKLQLQDYRLRVNTGILRKVSVVDAVCQTETCEVKIALDFVVGGVSISQSGVETWIFDEGSWWFVYRG